MKDYNYIAGNEQILNEWCEKFVEKKKNDEAYKGYKIEDYFARDGIMNKGDFDILNDGTIIRKPSDTTYSKENKMWKYVVKKLN